MTVRQNTQTEFRSLIIKQNDPSQPLPFKERGVNFPFSPARVHLFYGWIILVLGALGILMSIPGQTMGVSVFTGSLVSVLGISRLSLSVAYMIGTIGSSLMLANAGRFYDRFGVRLTLMLAGIILGFILILASQIDHAAALMAAPGLLSFEICAFIILTLVFFILRFAGQGVMTMVCRSMVMKWFDKRRGMAAAILGVFTTFGFSYAPKILDNMITAFTWRGAWIQLALLCGFTFSMMAMIFYRDSPRQCGMKPDGLGEVKVKGKIVKRARGEDITLREAKKRPILWIFALSLAVWGLYNTAFTFHIVSIFGKIGIDRSTALSIFFPISILSVIFRFSVSWISDHIRLEYIYLVYLIAMILAAVSLIFLQEGHSLMPIITGMGVAGGIFGALGSITWVRLFGKAHLGAVSGFAMGWTVAGSAVGPYFFSLSERMTGMYAGGAWFTIISSVILVAGVIYLLIKTKVKEE